jgi:hypothetical protein
MKKFKVEKSQVLSKNAQKDILGGRPVLSSCPSGCFDMFFAAIDGVRCAVPSNTGEICFGTVNREGKCCL